MAKKKELKDYSVYDTNIEEVDVGEYVKDVVVKYGINVSVFRACFAILDGLTPGQRRRLYTLYQKKAFPGKMMVKASDVLGLVSALHPHGGLSIDKSFKNDIKDWETNAPLYDVHGNRGSVAGDSASAIRYLDTRLTPYAMKCFFDDFDPSITEMVPSNTRTQLEPVVIPSKYPNFLLSNATGIAWGNAISMVPFNLKEVFQLTIALIKNPDMTGVYLYPDSPRGYDIIENPNIKTICDVGHGTLKIQAIIEYGEEDKIRYLDISGFPEQQTMNTIMAKIAKLVLNKDISGIDDLQNRSSIGNVHFWVILKKDADPDVVMNMLYEKTTLRFHLSLDFNFAGRTKMQPLGLKDALLFWIDNRIDMKQRWYIKRLHVKTKRIHEIEGIVKMLDPKNLDTTISIIRSSSTDEDSVQRLMEEFGATSYQAMVINDTKINRMNKSYRDKFLEEKETLEKEIDTIREIVTSPKRIKEVIIDELEEGIKLFGKPRNCNVISADALKPVVYKFNVIITKKYIKKVSTETTNIGALDPDDKVIGFFSNIPDDNQLFIVDTLGKTYGITVSKLKPCELVNRGTSLKELGVKGEPITSFRGNKDEVVDNMSLLMFTNSGIIKRTPLRQYITNRSELQGIILNKGDSVCHVMVYDESNPTHALLYTKNGFGLIIEPDSITVTDRLTKGSNYLTMEDEDTIHGVCECDNEVFILTEKGYGKICELDDIMKAHKRRQSMIRLTGLADGDIVFTMMPISGSKKLQCVLQSGNKIDVDLDNSIRTTRVSKGKKLVPVKRGDSIIRIKEIK